MKSGDDRSRRLAAILLAGTCRRISDHKLLCTRAAAKVHAHLLTTTTAATLLAVTSAQASRIFQEQPRRRTNGSRPFGLPLPKRPRLRATASAALNLVARIAIPVIVLNGVSGVASAQSTWVGTPPGDWNTPSNWNPTGVPAANGTAIFGAAPTTSVSWAGVVSVGTLQFNAPNYTFDFGQGLTINGAGINQTASVPTFNVIGTTASTPSMDFFGNSRAGTATIIAGLPVSQNGGFDSGFIKFHDTSTADNATITARDGSNIEFHNSSFGGTATLTAAPGGFIFFNETSSADHANIAVQSGGQLIFSLNDGGEFQGGTSTAGNATITSSGLIEFHDRSSAGNATINTHFGQTSFFDTSTAGNAAFTVIEGNMDFFNNSSAGTATINAGLPVSQNGGFDAGFIKFHDTSTAGNATIFSLDGSSVEFHDSSRADHATLIAGRNGFIEFVDASSGDQAKSSTTLVAKSE